MLQLLIFIGLSIVLCILDILIECLFDDLSSKAWRRISKEHLERKTFSGNYSIARYEDTLQTYSVFTIYGIVLITGLGAMLQTIRLAFVNLQENVIIYNLFLMCFAGITLCFIFSLIAKIDHLVKIHVVSKAINSNTKRKAISHGFAKLAKYKQQIIINNLWSKANHLWYINALTLIIPLVCTAFCIPVFENINNNLLSKSALNTISVILLYGVLIGVIGSYVYAIIPYVDSIFDSDLLCVHLPLLIYLGLLLLALAAIHFNANFIDPNYAYLPADMFGLPLIFWNCDVLQPSMG